MEQFAVGPVPALMFILVKQLDDFRTQQIPARSQGSAVLHINAEQPTSRLFGDGKQDFR